MDSICCTLGISLTAGLSSARVAIPLDSHGRPAALVRVTALPSASVHIAGGDSNVTATSNHLLLSNGRDIVINTGGMTHIAAIQAGLNLGGLVNVVPYE